VGTEGLINAAGSDAEGVIITQVVPPYDRVDLPTIQLYRKALDKYMFGTSPSFVSLEGSWTQWFLSRAWKRRAKI